ncbi:MAG: helix-turn-helix domain-containing protein [Microbacterium sp.]
MKRAAGRSDCPINATVEALGDTWSLLILRDMLVLGKQRFGDFLSAEEGIGTSVLAERLAALERGGIIARERDPSDGRRTIYTPARGAVDAIPLLLEAVRWGSASFGGLPEGDPWRIALDADRDEVVPAWQAAVRGGDSFFFGEGSAVTRMSALEPPSGVRAG